MSPRKSPKNLESRVRAPRKNKGRGSAQDTGENATIDGHVNPEAPENQPEQPANVDPVDCNNSDNDDDYLPPVDDLDGLEAEEFVIPEDREGKEQFRQHLIATSQSLKARKR